ncbi:MAG: four helix bundle protein [Bacteroidaceae bacterium]|nr:four helix bundle protein [Bacteroidaceae bacterium]MBQ9175347.1 four helix bundle protein [Bacteroidaceae bacterium]MBR1379685.1 four helix bundle protein [Bacteroidaceae bacterium]
MTESELKFRLKQFALRIIKLVDNMPYSTSSKALANQIMRSGTSPYANYCSACLAKSDKDFINKLKIVEEELDETQHWIELIGESGLVKEGLLTDLYNECTELLRIIVASIVTMKNKMITKEINGI